MANLLLFFHLITVLLAASLVRGQFRNISVDDTDPAIAYNPPNVWTLTATTRLDFPYGDQSSHSVSTQPGATAVFAFTGVAVYYLSPKWPYLVNSLVSLDGEPGTCVDLQDYNGVQTPDGHETIASSAVWFRDGLSNTTHTVTVTYCPGAPYVVVDGFIYTVSNATSSATTSSSQTSTSMSTTTISASSTATASSRTKIDVLAIAIGGALGGALVLALLILGIVFFNRRRGRPHPKFPDYPIDLTASQFTAYAPLPQAVESNPPPYPSTPGPVPTMSSTLKSQPLTYTDEHFNPYASYGQSSTSTSIPASQPHILTYSNFVQHPNVPEL